MRVELSRLLFWKTSPDESIIFGDYQTRIAIVSLRLKEGNEIYPGQDSSEQIGRDKLPNLLNGKRKYLEGNDTSMPTIYAWVRDEKAWISIGLEDKRLTYLLKNGEKPTCLLERKLPSGKWGRPKKIEEVKLSEVEAIINLAESVASRPLLRRSSSS